MSAFSKYLRDALIDHSLAGVQHTTPGSVFLALHGVNAATGTATDPGDEAPKQGDPGSTEVAWTSYERIQITFGAITQESGKSVKRNDGTVTFAAVDVGEGPWTITGFSIWSDTLAAGGGNELFHQAVDNVKTLDDSDVASFPVGSVAVKLD